MPKKPNIILLSLDAMRFDCMGAEPEKKYLRKYGYENLPCTPNLDRLASEGTVFHAAYSASPYTPTSHATMLTGLYPPRHGVRSFFLYPLHSKAKNLFEHAKPAGYTCIMGCNADPAFRLTGLSRGADHYSCDDDPAFFKAVSDHRDDPLCVFFHLGDAMARYGRSLYAPDGGTGLYDEDRFKWEEEELMRKAGIDPAAKGSFSALHLALRKQKRMIPLSLYNYLLGVNKMDVGRFAHFLERLGSLGVLDDALLVITADHGDAEREGDNFAHGYDISDRVVRVPLIFHRPGQVKAGAHVDTEVSQVDLLPTILELAGIEPVADKAYPIQGRSLAPAMGGGRITPSPIFSETWFYNWYQMEKYRQKCLEKGRTIEAEYETFLFQRQVREGHWKYVRFGGEFGEKDWSLSGSKFIRALYNKVLVEFEDPGDADRLLQLLAMGKADKKVLHALFAQKQPRREHLYRVDRDPFEECDLMLVPEISGYGPLLDRLRDRLEAIEADACEYEGRLQYKDDAAFEKAAETLAAMGYISR
jgi:arylsulfatase A-like enzyme